MVWKVYIIETEDSKIYIGCTSQSLQIRLNEHKSRKMIFVLKPHTFQIAFETNSKEAAHEYEAYLIQKFDSTSPKKGYNRRFGGPKYSFPDYIFENRKKTIEENGGFYGEKNSHFGLKHSDEAKEKIRQKALERDPSTFANNKIKTLEQLEKLQKGREKYYKENGAYFKGKHHTDEAKKKISELKKGNTIWLGKKHSEETKEKIRQIKLSQRKILHCNMENCTAKYKAKGYCNTHYRYFLKHGFP